MAKCTGLCTVRLNEDRTKCTSRDYVQFTVHARGGDQNLPHITLARGKFWKCHSISKSISLPYTVVYAQKLFQSPISWKKFSLILWHDMPGGDEGEEDGDVAERGQQEEDDHGHHRGQDAVGVRVAHVVVVVVVVADVAGQDQGGVDDAAVAAHRKMLLLLLDIHIRSDVIIIVFSNPSFIAMRNKNQSKVSIPRRRKYHSRRRWRKLRRRGIFWRLQTPTNVHWQISGHFLVSQSVTYYETLYSTVIKLSYCKTFTISQCLTRLCLFFLQAQKNGKTTPFLLWLFSSRLPRPHWGIHILTSTYSVVYSRVEIRTPVRKAFAKQRGGKKLAKMRRETVFSLLLYCSITEWKLGKQILAFCTLAMLRTLFCFVHT